MLPSEYARLTADTLNTSMCQQIIGFLRSSAKNDDLLSPKELCRLHNAADALEEILKWQTPSSTSSN